MLTRPSYRLPIRFDVAKLRADLALVDGTDWRPHFHKEDFSGEWSGLALRSLSGRVDDLFAHPGDPDDYRPTPLLEQCPSLQQVIAELGLQWRGVRLLSLGAGSRILPHRDRGLAYRFGELRLHIPILTGDAVEFVVAGERVVMAPGECWYCDFDREHSVVNSGSERRVHLVLDAPRDARSDELLADARMPPVTEFDAMDEDTQRRVAAQLQQRGDDTSLRLAAAILASLS
ncbi:MAG: aspartyl/asparaginyl beta-hydroxylase domain-containing protein [Burkholderiales bacterium]|nr:aspartyl/asparaginyl beta-hydroxylase domain-containing protein [Burkholderiales bacterium]